MIAKYSTIPDKFWKHQFLWRMRTIAMLLLLPILVIVACFLEGYRNVFDGTFLKTVKEIFAGAFCLVS